MQNLGQAGLRVNGPRFPLATLPVEAPTDSASRERRQLIEQLRRLRVGSGPARSQALIARTRLPVLSIGGGHAWPFIE
jgi:hypothetical protein